LLVFVATRFRGSGIGAGTIPTTRLNPRKQPVQARAVETRDRILDAAARVFGAHGYSAGTTNRIAAEAELSVGSLYQYFPNKDAILVELVRRHVTEGTEAFRTRLAGTGPGTGGLPPDLAGRIELFVDVMIANHSGDPALHQVLFEEAPRPPELLAQLHDLEEALIEATAGLLATDPEVRVDDHRLAARMVVTTIESLVHRVVATRRPGNAAEPEPDHTAFRRELTTMLVRYLRG
jgi:AcrR family transcriptional regulator